MRRRDFFRAIGLATTAPVLPRALPQQRPTPSFLDSDPKNWIDVSPGPRLEGWTEYPWFGTEGEQWRHVNQWHMDPANGILLCDGHSQAHTMLLRNGEFEDFIFHVEWRFTPIAGKEVGYNSGVLVRMLPETDNRKVMYQVETGSTPDHAGWLRGGSLVDGKLNVMNTKVRMDGEWHSVDPGFPRAWGAHVKTARSGSDTTGRGNAYDARIDAPVKPPGEWNSYEVVCKGSRITVWTNGVESSYADNIQTLRGRIGLEAERYRIEFRNLRLKDLA